MELIVDCAQRLLQANCPDDIGDWSLLWWSRGNGRPNSLQIAGRSNPWQLVDHRSLTLVIWAGSRRSRSEQSTKASHQAHKKTGIILLKCQQCQSLEITYMLFEIWLQIRVNVGSEQNGRGKVVGRERKQILSILDAPDDVYFIATDATRYVTHWAVLELSLHAMLVLCSLNDYRMGGSRLSLRDMVFLLLYSYGLRLVFFSVSRRTNYYLTMGDVVIRLGYWCIIKKMKALSYRTQHRFYSDQFYLHGVASMNNDQVAMWLQAMTLLYRFI